ncbi:MAG: peptidylprolyl isomerase [Chloroherpetonaceae bacterium]|nr:peptidylprolyl isomerase [Chloroherpetonaceae bacterium]
MPIMSKMRDNMHIVLYVLVGAFLITIIFEWGMNYSSSGGRRNEAGRVNGKPVLFAEYDRAYRVMLDNYRQQMQGMEIDEQMDGRIREQAWENIIMQNLLEVEYKKLGIEVTDKEIVEAIYSPNPPEVIAQQFRDPATGLIDREKLQSAISDKRNKAAWVQVEEYISREKMYEKFQRTLSEAVFVSEEEARNRFKKQTEKLSAKYVLFDFSRLKPDSTFEVSESEISAYYREHKEEYKQEPSRTAKFVLFSNSATAEDTLKIREELQRLIPEFASAPNDTDFIAINSDSPIGAGKNYAIESLTEEQQALLYSPTIEKGKVIGPIEELGTMKLIKITGVETRPEPTIRASHILLKPQGESKSDTMKTIEEAKKLIAKIKAGAKFDSLAQMFSEDPGSGARGGDLGWFGKGRMVKPFEEASYKLKVGEVSAPVQSQFGIHIIKLTGKEDREVKAVELSRKITASATTLERQRRAASDYQYFATEEGFEKEAENRKLEVRETGSFQKNGFIFLLGFSPSVSRFAFAAKEGEISKVIEVKDGFTVVKVTGINDEGYRPLDESLQNEIKEKVRKEKKIAELREMAKGFIQKAGGDIDKLATLDQGLTVQTTGQVMYNSGMIPGLGRENALVGVLSETAVGKMTAPVEVQRGVAVAVLSEKIDGTEEEFNSQKEALMKQILREKKEQVMRAWVEGMKKKAEIEDNREAFYN